MPDRRISPEQEGLAAGLPIDHTGAQTAAAATTGARVVRGGLWKMLANALPQLYALVLSVVAARYLGPSGMGRQSFIAFIEATTITLLSGSFSLALMRSSARPSVRAAPARRAGSLSGSPDRSRGGAHRGRCAGGDRRARRQAARRVAARRARGRQQHRRDRARGRPRRAAALARRDHRRVDHRRGRRRGGDRRAVAWRPDHRDVRGRSDRDDARAAGPAHSPVARWASCKPGRPLRPTCSGVRSASPCSPSAARSSI